MVIPTAARAAGVTDQRVPGDRQFLPYLPEQATATRAGLALKPAVTNERLEINEQ